VKGKTVGVPTTEPATNGVIHLSFSDELHRFITRIQRQREQLTSQLQRLESLEKSASEVLEAVNAPVIPQPKPEKKADGTYRIQSRTEPTISYNVRLVNKVWSCSCPAGQHGQKCWHVTAVEQAASEHSAEIERKMDRFKRL